MNRLKNTQIVQFLTPINFTRHQRESLKHGDDTVASDVAHLYGAVFIFAAIFSLPYHFSLKLRTETDNHLVRLSVEIVLCEFEGVTDSRNRA